MGAKRVTHARASERFLHAAVAAVFLPAAARSGQRPGPHVPAHASGLRASVGQVIAEKDSRGKITDEAARRAAQEAVRQCIQGFEAGAPCRADNVAVPTAPRLIVIAENIRRTRAIIAGVEAAAGGIRFCGVNTGGYASLSIRGFPHKDRPAISALAIGGDGADVLVRRVDLPKIRGAQYAWALKGEPMFLSAAEHARAGRELWQAFPQTSQGRSRILVVLGTLHTPRQTWFAEDIKASAPDDLHVIGGAGADFGSVYADGRSHENSALGILISGDFEIGVAGEEKAEDIPGQLEVSMQRARNQIRPGTPRLALYFGCASWHKRLDEQLETFRRGLGAGFPLFGQFCGGEIGRFDKGRKVRAEPNLAVLAILASGR